MFFESFETSNTWENAWVARCRLVCIILEKVEVGFELESEKGGLRSSVGRVSAKCEGQITTWSLFSIQLTFYVAAVDTNKKSTMCTFPDKGLIKSTRVEVLQGLKSVKV